MSPPPQLSHAPFSTPIRYKLNNYHCAAWPEIYILTDTSTSGSHVEHILLNTDLSIPKAQVEIALI